MRPVTARSFIGSLPDESDDGDPDDLAIRQPDPSWELDPGWILAEALKRRALDKLTLIAERPWWPMGVSSGPVAELLANLWRHSVAVGIVARRLARNAGDPEAEAVARAGRLCSLGTWAVAAVAPEWLVAWSRQDDPVQRERMEWSELGSDLGDLGRRLAERWGCDPLVVDAAWLHADPLGTLDHAASSPDRLAMIQEAYRSAELTPWAQHRLVSEPVSHEPRLRILIAEVQARCGIPFVDPSATPDEERATRQNARLRLQVGRLRDTQGRTERFLELLAASSPGETPDEWADRASRTLCAEPGVGAARITWSGPDEPATRDGVGPAAPPSRADSTATGDNRHPPNVVLTLNAAGAARASAELWCEGEQTAALQDESSRTILRAWGAWADLLADRSRLEQRLQAVVTASRRRVQAEDERLRREKLDALGEFAAGAGHELNNPLAVIVGRAQLLLARADDPEVVRSLRIITGQAQRAHRILRDLIFVARPPAPRPRPCNPDEVLGSLLGEFERESASRGVRMLFDLDTSTASSWADPEGLRHLAEILLRNAMQATPPGGRIHVRSVQVDGKLVWSFSDNGKGIAATEAKHLFDPFYCGRQAGRGLGLGLPRAAKIVEQAGGKLRWSSSPGHETTFQVHLPLTPPPDAGESPLASGRFDDRRLPQRMLKT